jgi:hypothetical protein
MSGVGQRYHLKGEHPTNQRLGIRSVIRMDAASSVRKQQDAAPIGTLGQPEGLFPKAPRLDDRHVTEVRMFFPGLSAQTLEVFFV